MAALWTRTSQLNEDEYVAELDNEIVGLIGSYLDRVELTSKIDIARALKELSRLYPHPPTVPQSQTVLFGHITELCIDPSYKGAVSLLP